MNMKTGWKQWLAAGIVLGAMLLGALLLAPQTTFAQTDDGADSGATPQVAPWGRGGMKFEMGDFGGMRDEYQGYLAEALGITVEELQAAQLQAQNAMIDQAVEDGALTQEQADLMKARRAFMQFYMSEEQQSLEDALNAAVEAGAITQEQADMLLNAQGQFGRGMDGPGMDGPGMFGRGMDGGMFQGPGGRGGHGEFHHRGMMPGMDDEMPGYGNRMMPGNQAPTATPEANS